MSKQIIFGGDRSASIFEVPVCSPVFSIHIMDILQSLGFGVHIVPAVLVDLN